MLTEQELRVKLNPSTYKINYDNKEYILKNYIQLGNGKKTSIDSLYNLNYFVREGVHIVTAAQHHTWDFLMGKGKTMEHALKDLRVMINMYDPEFQKLQKEYNFH